MKRTITLLHGSAMPVKPTYLLIAAGGAVVLWSGIKGYGISNTLRDVLSGKNPNDQKQLTSITGATYAYGYGSSAITGSVSGESIATDAEHYVGHAYSYGGAPGVNGTQPWDCSSFCNWVIGHDAGLAIPLYNRGKYTGASHGPPTGTWLVWTGCKTIPQSQAQPGDLAVWETHMGIFVDDGLSIISALNEQLGTRITSLFEAAPPGEILVCRRLRALI